MTVNIYSHPGCLEHKLHNRLFAERAGRVTRLKQLFNTLACNVDENIIPVTREQLIRVHTEEYVDIIKAMSHLGPVTGRLASFGNPFVQWYTRVSPGSYDAARYAAGTVFKAVEDTLSGKFNRGFCAIRPPGHHAGPQRGEGFCLFNNIALAADHAVRLGADRVAIVDFDRHHGNGTQAIIEQRMDNRVFLASSYQEGCKYAQNEKHGRLSDRILTVPIRKGATLREVTAEYARLVVPALYEFKPGLILISAGFDMHEADPLSSIKLKSGDYYYLTKMLTEVANRVCDGRIVSALEGGYDEQALAESVGYHLRALSEPCNPSLDTWA